MPDSESGDELRANDAKIERVVLYAILDAYPELYTTNELVREITPDPEDFAARDAIERVVLELYSVGLLHTFGPLVAPSRAAKRFNQINESDG